MEAENDKQSGECNLGESTMTVNELNTLATCLEALFDKMRIPAEVKAYGDGVEVSFDWDYCYGNFMIRPSKDSGYTVEDEYYVERFDTVQQVIDYLLKKDNDNAC